MGRPPTVLVANRGEIAIRVCRAACELSMESIAIFAEDDMESGHRQKADASYLIGQPGESGPGEAYLRIEAIIEIARERNADMIHPGYGFLSENVSFARAVRAAGITFVGPPTHVIESMGNKTSARDIANAAGIPIIPGTKGPVENLHDALDFIQQHGYPVLAKASFGGGGRGMRLIRHASALQTALDAARSEALIAFGNGSVFLEKYLKKPKHIEVQILADSRGNIVHFFERDCSVQRKHQKIIEFTPAQTLSRALTQSIHDAALRLAKYISYENAGTVEFLVEEDRFYFIEMNPRIQVEHTVTEEATGIDIVCAQLQIAAGKTLPEIGLDQQQISLHRHAIQCRVTTEIASQGFRPDTGRLEVCRLPMGPGIRLDHSQCFQGAQITPAYDPLLLKCTSSAQSWAPALRKAIRALRELRIRGVETNVSFLIQILSSREFEAGGCWTTFIDDNTHLSASTRSQDRASKFLRFLANSAVNGTQIQGQMKPPAIAYDINPGTLLDDQTGNVIDVCTPPTQGWRPFLLEHGPAKFAQKIREHKHTLLTDTTWRDGQQSVLATRIRTRDLAVIAPTTRYAYRNAYSMENWGGATFDVALRFLYEDPWDRLRTLRKLIPNIPFQMLLRSTNGVAYSALPDNAIFHFVRLAKEAGMDIFRVFDCLNNTDNLEVGIRAVHAAGGVVEGAVMYTGDMMRPGKYNLDYYMTVIDKLVGFGCHIIAVKSMSGVMKPNAGRTLVRAIRAKYPDIPIHMHTHDNNGTGVTTMLACVEAGADIVDTASDSLSGSTSQPAISSMLAALEGSGFDAELSLDQVAVIDKYWEQLRLVYSGFDADLRSPDPSIYKHEIPGGQYSNLVFQARQNGLGDQWQATLLAYEESNHLLGDIIKATPTSKAVGDLAQFMVDHKLSAADVRAQATTLDFPSSVLDYFEGLMGQPFDGFPEPFRSQVLRSRRAKLSCRPGLMLEPVDFDGIRKKLEDLFPEHPISEYDIASYLMYPEVYCDFRRFRRSYGDLTYVRTYHFLVPPKINEKIGLRIEDGKELTAVMVSVGEPDMSSGTREVLFRLNGELRSISVVDQQANPKRTRLKANPNNDSHISAPMSGKIIRVMVPEKGCVSKGDPVLALTAMKMEFNVSARCSGQVEQLHVKCGDSVEKDDLLLTIQPDVDL